jgi:transcriptional regulator with XRE-family HTH domain
LKRAGSTALGDRIRKFRVKLSMSQVALAQRVGRSEGWLVQVENGRADPGHGDLLNIAAVLNVDISDLVPAQRTTAPTGTAGSTPHDPTAMAHRKGDQAVQPAQGRLVDDERLTFALTHPHQIDRQSIDDLAALTRLYASQAQSMAPGALMAVVAALMQRLRALLAGSQTASVRQRLQALYAENATMAGRLAFWSDDRGQSEHLLKLAASLATEVNERHLLAVVLAFRADLYSTVPYIGTVPNNTNVALALFEEAATLDARDTPPLLRSWVYGCRAEEYATLKRPSESDRDMERAHTARAAAGPMLGADQVLDISTLDMAAAAAGLTGFEGACALALGRAKEAREAFAAGLREQSSIGRLSGLAAAYALEGDIEPAVELLTQGLEEAIARQLPTRRRRVEGVRAAFLSHASDHPAVQRFDERLRAAIG